MSHLSSQAVTCTGRFWSTDVSPKRKEKKLWNASNTLPQSFGGCKCDIPHVSCVRSEHSAASFHLVWPWLDLEHGQQALERTLLPFSFPQSDGERQGVKTLLEVWHARVGGSSILAFERLTPGVLRSSTLRWSRTTCWGKAVWPSNRAAEKKGETTDLHWH